MKKILALTILSLSTLVVSGCTDPSENNSVNNSIESNTETIETSMSSSSSNIEDALFVDGPLIEPGQWTNGSILYTEKVSLLKISNNPTVKEIIPGLQMTIDSVKLMKNEGLSDDFYDMTGIDASYIVDDAFYTLQISYTISNDTETVQDFNGIEYITTSAREQIDVSYNNFSGVEMTFQPAVDVPGNIVLSVISPEGANDISSINLAFWSLFPEGADDLVQPSPLEINFN